MESKIFTRFDILDEETLENYVESIVLYAYANVETKIWYLTKRKNNFLPKGSRLLLKLFVKKYFGNNTFIKKTYPTVDDIVSDINGTLYKILDVKDV